jgi:hypothetical protein
MFDEAAVLAAQEKSGKPVASWRSWFEVARNSMKTIDKHRAGS